MIEGLVSVIVPAYNCEKFIGETIASVLAQTYQNWEMIIVDDCSSDNTREIILDSAKKDSRIKYYFLQNNSGAAVARNTAMEQAEGEYMAFLDSDDVWLPEKLEKQLNFMRDNNVAFSATSYELIDEKSRPLGRMRVARPKTDYQRMLYSNVLGNSTVMYDVGKLGKFKIPDIRKRNDYVLWLAILKKEKYAVGMPEILMQYRVRKQSLSSNKFGLIKYHWHIYRNIEKISFIYSLYYTACLCTSKLLGHLVAKQSKCRAIMES